MAARAFNRRWRASGTLRSWIIFDMLITYFHVEHMSTLIILAKRTGAVGPFWFAPSVDADAVWRAITRASHLAPGFAVDFVDGAAPRAFRKKIELPVKFGYGDGNHIPQIFGNDVDRNEVD